MAPGNPAGASRPEAAGAEGTEERVCGSLEGARSGPWVAPEAEHELGELRWKLDLPSGAGAQGLSINAHTCGQETCKAWVGTSGGLQLSCSVTIPAL